ncbi:MAG: ACT domain-containing protein [Oscillospiraceae bacterium]
MACTVKYIGNCKNQNIDISTLYRKDVALGTKVVLVCETEDISQYLNDEITKVSGAEQVWQTENNPVLLSCPFDGRMLAIECAAYLGAGECQFFIQNDGFYSADPEELEIAKKLNKIDYDEVLEVCSSGYKALDGYMIELAKKHSVVIHLLSYNRPDVPGTVIKEVLGDTGMLIKGVIKDPNITIITLTDIPDRKGISYHIFKAISDADIVVDIILLPATGTKRDRQDISFTVGKNYKRTAEKVLREKQTELGFSDMVIDDNVAKVSVIGAGMQSSFGVATTLFKVLYENDINLRMINSSEIKIAVVIDKDQSDLAVHKIHEAFIK